MEGNHSSINGPEKVSCKVKFLRFIKRSGRILKLIALYPFSKRMCSESNEVNNVNGVKKINTLKDKADINTKCSFKICKRASKGKVSPRLNNKLYNRSTSLSTDESISNKLRSNKSRNTAQMRLSIASNIKGRQIFKSCSIKDFVIGETIGTGSYATVCIAKYTSSSGERKSNAVPERGESNESTSSIVWPNNTSLYVKHNGTDELESVEGTGSVNSPYEVNDPDLYVIDIPSSISQPDTKKEMEPIEIDEIVDAIDEVDFIEAMEDVDDQVNGVDGGECDKMNQLDRVDDTNDLKSMDDTNDLKCLDRKDEDGVEAVDKIVALKILNKTKIVTNKQMMHVKSESEILGFVNHPFIVGYLGRFQDCHNLYFILEFLGGGELFTYLRKYGRFSKKSVQFYAAQVLMALEYLHHNGVVYRDLKPENIILDFMGYIRLVDFGFAKVIRDGGRTWTVCGTYEYLAPEVFLKRGHGFQADFYSLGVLLYELLVGVPPFYASDPQVTYKLALNHQIKFPKYLCSSSKGLIKNLLEINPEKRLGNDINAVYLHDFFTGIDFNRILLKAENCPILPSYGGSDDVSNFIKYPETWKKHKGDLTAEQQDLFKFF